MKTLRGRLLMLASLIAAMAMGKLMLGIAYTLFFR